MASLKPFRAYRYSKQAGDLLSLVYPMSESLSPELLQRLQGQPHSTIHFSRSRGLPGKPYAVLVTDWIHDNIIEQDPLDALYVWYQYYSDGEVRKVRKGFTCQVKLQEWSDRIILPHEKIIPKSVQNKQDFLAETGLSFAPLQALYEDKDHELEKLMDEAIQAPLYDFTDEQEIRNVVARIHDYEVANLFRRVLKDKQFILADGHHRYHAALEYSHKMDQRFPNQPEAPWHYLNMYLSNTEDPGLKILPFHREFSFDEEVLPMEFIEKAKENFNVIPLKTLHEIPGKLSSSQTALGVISGESGWILEWKQISKNSTYQRITDTYISLIQEFVVDNNLKKQVHNLKSINFSSNFNTTLKAVVSEKKAKLALILQPTSIEEVKRVCYAGGIMPEKSTFFYPKLMAGLLFSRIEHDQQT